jgi:hypothetical protein
MWNRQIKRKEPEMAKKLISTMCSTPAALAEAGVGMAGIIICAFMGSIVLAFAAAGVAGVGVYSLYRYHPAPKY